MNILERLVVCFFLLTLIAITFVSESQDLSNVQELPPKARTKDKTITELTDTQLTRILEETATPLLVIFHERGCPFSRRLLSLAEALCDVFPQLPIYKIDLNKYRNIIWFHNIYVFPVLILFNSTKEIARSQSNHSVAAVVEFIAKHTRTHHNTLSFSSFSFLKFVNRIEVVSHSPFLFM
jgi:thioredoxin-like negative regulator of GroEL